MKTRHKKLLRAIPCLLLGLVPAVLHAAPPVITQQATPGTMSYQARVQASDGSDYSNGVYTVEFRLYDSGIGGTLLWATAYRPFLQNGFISVILGQTGVGEEILSEGQTYPNDFWKAVWIDPAAGDTDRFLEIKVAAFQEAPIVGATPSFPRQQLLAAPFALQAQFAEQAAGTNFNVYGADAGITIDNTAETQSGLIIRDAQGPDTQHFRCEYNAQNENVYMYLNGGTDPVLSLWYGTGDSRGIGINRNPKGDYAMAVQGADDGDKVGYFNKVGDGIIFQFARDGSNVGDISVSGGTVSYNNFTGSHVAWTDKKLDRGYLVSMTGDNRRMHGSDEHEIIYGIRPSPKANDPAVLGAYLDTKDPSLKHHNPVPHLVMSAGNGDVWVVDTGRDIQPGDLLISSDVPGHAMVDPRTDPESHVFGRAAESVIWDNVSESINGTKRYRVSVLFNAFTRNNKL